MNIIMISSEVFPFAKTGGLGDVVPQLSEALSGIGHDVKILMPLYGSIDRSVLTRLPSSLTVQIAGVNYSAGLYRKELTGGSTVYFLDYEPFYGRSNIYVDESGNDYPDNLLRFALLSRAVFALCSSMNWRPDIINAHDWSSALAMTWLRKEQQGFFAETSGVFSIHNIGYQGIFDFDQFPTLGFSQGEYQGLGFAYYEKISLLRSALACADSIVAVSPQYAREILGDEFGFGMQDLLRKRRDRLSGILNGADYNVWNPESDKLIPHRFDSGNMADKARNKRTLQEEHGLESSDRPPLIGIVSRLVTQKGFKLLLGEEGSNLRRICTELDIQLIILGLGEAWIEEALQEIAAEQDNFSVIIGYNEQTSHLIQAASDFFLVPSLYEPCGLTQIYALRYGSLPIVSRVGGLLDTVIDIDDDGTGILIGTASDIDLNSESIFHALDRACKLWQNRQHYLLAQQQAMEKRFTWEQAAQKYTEIYKGTIYNVDQKFRGGK